MISSLILTLMQCHSINVIYQRYSMVVIRKFLIGTFNSIHTMDSEYFQKCLFIFYLLGQNSYIPRTNKITVWLQHFPRIFYILLTLAVIVRHYKNEGYLQKPEALVLYVIWALTFAINAFVLLECFLVPNGVRILHSACKDTIDYLERKLYFKINYEPFKQSFQCSVQIVFWTFLATVSIKLYFVLNGKANNTEFMVVFYLKHFASMHILFHIEFVHFLMKTINTEFDPMKNQPDVILKLAQPKTVELLQKLRHLKSVHFRMWKIIQILSARFGWILIALMLANLLDITYSSYWIWMYIHNTCAEHINLFMRKYST